MQRLGHVAPLASVLTSFATPGIRLKSDGLLKPLLSLIWAVLELTSRGWRGVVMTPRSVAEIERLRRRQHSGATEEVIAA
jgi:hypothetical protein